MHISISDKLITNNSITIVSGLPRSGTSMMMKILALGNMPLLIDNIRRSDEDNPKGYFEYEKVKELNTDNSWLETACGKAIKIVSPLLFYLNLDITCRYKIIFMLRNIDEILASQRKMSDRLNKGKDNFEDNILKQNYSLHLEEIQNWLKQHENVEVLYINYSDVIREPLSVAKNICNFLNMDLNVNDMTTAIDSSLYRQRAEPAENYKLDTSSKEQKNDELIMERLKHLGYF